MIVTDAQREHLRQHADLIAEHQGEPGIDVDEYVRWAEDDDEGPYSGYYYLCLDLGLTPLQPHPKEQ